MYRMLGSILFHNHLLHLFACIKVRGQRERRPQGRAMYRWVAGASAKPALCDIDTAARVFHSLRTSRDAHPGVSVQELSTCLRRVTGALGSSEHVVHTIIA